MSSYVSVLNPSTNNVEGHQKWLNRLYSPGVATNYSTTSLQVVQRGAGANMSVDVSIGDALLQLPSLANGYWGWTDAATNATIATADATNPRIDTIVAWVDQSAASAGTTNSLNGLKFMSVAGTPSGTPVAAIDATIQTAVGASSAWTKLATVLVGAGVLMITNANITDARVQLAPRLTDNSINASKIAHGSCSFKGYFTTLQSQATNTWTTFTPNAGTSGSRSITTNGGKIFVSLEAPLWVSSGNGEIGILINGTDYEMATYSGSTGEAKTYTTVITGVPAGTYTIDIRLKSSGGAGNNINANHDLVLTAFEV